MTSAASSLDRERLRSVIDEHLRSTNVYEDIRNFVAGFAADGGADSQDSIVDALKSKGVIDDIVASVGKKTQPADLEIPTPEKPSRRFLHLKILGGSAFVDDIAQQDTQGRFELHVHFRNQRLRSKPVECAVEPAFNDSFLLELQPPGAQLMLDPHALLQIEDAPLHFVLLRLRRDDDGVRRELVSTQKVEWRRVVGRGGVSTSVQLMATGAEAKMQRSIGVLQLRMDLIPPAPHGRAVSASEISQQLQMEAARSADVQQQFFSYAKQWWKEYSEIRPAFKHRLVKIFAENEYGEHRSVCSFLYPLQAGRLLDTPRHAARFVGLLPHTREDAVGGGRVETWYSIHSFLALGRGDCENHAVLTASVIHELAHFRAPLMASINNPPQPQLASLLLGFGLDAYVVVGTADGGEGERDHVWVMTRTSAAANDAENPSGVMFWESTTGKRILPHSQAHTLRFQYRTVACVFSHETFYANLQVDDHVASCDFSLDDSALWKAMEPQVLATLPRPPPTPLIPAEAAEYAQEEELEDILRGLVREFRREQGLTTMWDDDLSFRIGPALAAYELERAVGATYGSEEFQSTIKRAVPAGHCFKGYPAVFTDASPHRMIASLRKGQVPLDILQCRGDHIRFALRTRVVRYPENVVAVWLMLAVRYMPVR